MKYIGDFEPKPETIVGVSSSALKIPFRNEYHLLVCDTQSTKQKWVRARFHRILGVVGCGFNRSGLEIIPFRRDDALVMETLKIIPRCDLSKVDNCTEVVIDGRGCVVNGDGIENLLVVLSEDGMRFGGYAKSVAFFFFGGVLCDRIVTTVTLLAFISSVIGRSAFQFKRVIIKSVFTTVSWTIEFSQKPEDQRLYMKWYFNKYKSLESYKRLFRVIV